MEIEAIVELIRKQKPERLDLIDQLRKQMNGSIDLRPYVKFVNSYKPNQKGSEWQFDENIILEHETEGTIVLDILKDGRIGGIEFISQIPD